MIHLCDKMPDACSRLGYILIVIEVNFFLLEGSDQAFRISVLPRDRLSVLMKSQSHDG